MKTPININSSFVDKYSRDFSQKVSASFFAEGVSSISGKEILNVTPSKQVNFFVVKQLFSIWVAEVEKLKSPYFNYGDEDVNEALTQMMNVLSMHIELKQDVFVQLLENAVADALLLIVAPSEYIKKALSQETDFSAEESDTFIKYIKVHKEKISEVLLSILEKKQSVDESMADYSVDAVVDSEMVLLSSILPISKNNILQENDTLGALLSPVEGSKSMETTLSKNKNFFDEEILTESKDENEAIEQAITYNQEVIEEEKFIKVAKDPLIKQEVTNKEEKEPEKETVNDKFEKEVETLADHHSKKQEQLKNSISTNQQFMFVRLLFHNDGHAFDQVLSKLEKHKTFDEIIEFLLQNTAKKYKWDMKSDEVKEFLKVMYRKFR